MVPQLIFQKAFVRFPDVLGQIAEEGKSGRLGRDLRDVLDLHILPLPSRGWVVFDDGQQDVIQFARRDFRCPRTTHLQGCLKGLQYTLLFDIGREHNGNVGEG